MFRPRDDLWNTREENPRFQASPRGEPRRETWLLALRRDAIPNLAPILARPARRGKQ